MVQLFNKMKPYTPQPREYYISKCRYYKGGDEENTLPSPDSINAFYESCWVELHYSEHGIEELRQYVRDYKKFGLGHFNENDEVPIALKAFIWSRYMHWGSEYETPKSFKEWWRHFYLHEE